MKKTIVNKEKTNYGLRLDINFGSVNDRLYFSDESEFNGLVYMLRMMVSMNAASITVDCPGEDLSEEGDKPDEDDEDNKESASEDGKQPEETEKSEEADHPAAVEE